MKSIESPSGLSIHYRGIPLEEGKLPAFFYFALSGDDSLHLDPFNQPAVFLDSLPMRVFSFTIPGHGPGLKNTEAMRWWADQIKLGHNPLSPFIDDCLTAIDHLVRHDLVDESKMAVGGLSRGGFIAAHLAARDLRLAHLVGFAPLTTMATIHELDEIREHPIVQSLEIPIASLTETHVRFYIGNRDLRVGTDACYTFIRSLSDAAYAKGVRSPQAELIIAPSIGHKGHGTGPDTFRAGADWIASKLFPSLN
jgi:dienelactone hydrolase